MISMLFEKNGNGKLLGAYFKQKYPKKSSEQIAAENKSMRQRFLKAMEPLAKKKNIPMPKDYKL